METAVTVETAEDEESYYSSTGDSQDKTEANSSSWAWPAEDERMYQDSLHIVDKLHWEPDQQRDDMELAHHLMHHQGVDISGLRRMIRVALDSAQAAKGAITELLADMTALKKGHSPYRRVTGSYRDTSRTNGAASSGGGMRM